MPIYQPFTKIAAAPARTTIALAAIALATIALAPVAAIANPAGATYQVTVATSFGSKFTDCFSFDSAGTLTVAGYGPLSYTLEARGRSQSKFQALSSLATASSVGFTIQFNGLALGNTTEGYLKVSGSDEAGDTYQVRGAPNASCTADKSQTIYQHPS